MYPTVAEARTLLGDFAKTLGTSPAFAPPSISRTTAPRSERTPRAVTALARFVLRRSRRAGRALRLAAVMLRDEGSKMTKIDYAELTSGRHGLHWLAWGRFATLDPSSSRSWTQAARSSLR